MSAESKEKQLTFREIMDKSAKSAFRGGISGAAAMGANVACLMWMRTTASASFPSLYHELFLGVKHSAHPQTSRMQQVNYQYRNGTTFPTALRTLYADGGIPRFYRVSSLLKPDPTITLPALCSHKT
jgi:hypothetical protein